MTHENIRNLLMDQEFIRFINMSAVAKRSGISRQNLWQWVKGKQLKAGFSPRSGLMNLRLICSKVAKKQSISEKDFENIRPYLNVSAVADEFLNVAKSTAYRHLNNGGMVRYNEQLVWLCSFLNRKMEKIL